MQNTTTNVKTETNLLLGEWLIQKELITHEQLCEALSHQSKTGCRLGEALFEVKILTEEEVTQVLAEFLALEYFPLDDLTKIDMEVARLLPENIARRLCVIAIGEHDNRIVVTMSDPLNIVAIDTITVKLKQTLKVVISSPVRIREAIEVIYHGSDVEEQRLRDLIEIENSDGDGGEIDLVIEEENNQADSEGETEANQAPVIRFVDLLMSQAVKSRASDVHIEPQDKTMSVRMRVDGALREMVPPPRKMHAAVIARIKILSKMDISERRLPQDGRFKIKAKRGEIDIRVSAIPTIYGEKVVMRILDKTAVNHDIKQLGFESRNLEIFKKTLEQPHGIVIVTGPTGSGKSTTLYSSLNYIKDPTKNIVTVEDPVEYRLQGINQIQVRTEISLDFASCLRAILRQDPDIILIGEIRDKETVEIAMKASLTGHMVLSTFHTNDAPSAVTRLVHMGIEPFLLASTLNLVIAQRLVKRICEHCAKPDTVDPQLLQRLKIDDILAKRSKFMRGSGCNNCGGTGYSGRLPIFEFMPLTPGIRKMIVDREPESQLRTVSRQAGHGGLMDSGIGKLIQGLTTAEEVIRVTFEDDVNS